MKTNLIAEAVHDAAPCAVRGAAAGSDCLNPLMQKSSVRPKRRAAGPESKDVVRQERPSTSALRAYAQGKRFLKTNLIAEAVHDAAPCAVPRLEATA